MRESFYVQPVELDRSVYDAGLARCKRCQAFIRRSQIAPLALIRKVFGENADAGWCSSCGETTYFVLT